MKPLILFISVTMICGCSTEEKQHNNLVQTVTETQGLNAWLDEQFSEYLDFSPLSKTSLGDKSDYDKLDDVSEEMSRKKLDWRRQSVVEMKSRFNRNELDDAGKLSWDLWLYMLTAAEAGEPFIRHQYFFGRNGPHTRLPNNLINYHKVDEPGDIEAYISRLNQSGRYLGQYLVRAKTSAAEGIRAPYFTYEIAISQIKRVTSGKPFDGEGSSALWTDISSKIESLVDKGKLNDVKARQYTNEAKKALLNVLKPAYDDIKAWLESDRKNVSKQAKGAWSLPDGKAYYDYRLSRMTTLPLSSDEIHKTGLSEVARIQVEMEQIMRRVGFEGTLTEFFTFMREDDQFYFDNTDEGRAAYLAMANQYLEAMALRLPDFFGILPKAELQVRRVEAFREQPGAAAHYRRGTKDGSRPGVFYVHLSDMRAMANYRLEDLAYHEGLPGHHMAGSIQRELEEVPRFRTYHGYTAFSEGWALYAEFLGKEMGFYDNAYADFGRLSGEIWRAVRLVVDTGIHAKRWSEEQAVAYALANSPRPETSVRSEIRRYFNIPAQATAYKVGMMKIQQYRAHAEEQLGEKFDIRDFHDLVLSGGSLPMPLLESRVNQWILARK